MAENAMFEVRNAEIERLLKEIAQMIGGNMPEGFGFTLLLFNYDVGEQRAMFYISSAQRDGMIRAMREFIQKQGKN